MQTLDSPIANTAFPKPAQAGFTLIELMVVLAVAIIIGAIGVPSMYQLIASNRLSTYTNELVGGINLARSEAIKRGQRVVLCKSSDGVDCDANAQWSDGWIIFEDRNGTRSTVNNGEVIRIHGPVSDAVTITFTGFTNNDLIEFNALGRPTTLNGTFSVRDNNGSVVGRNIIISTSGRLRTEYASDNS